MKKFLCFAIFCFLSSQLLAQSSAESKKGNQPVKFSNDGGLIRIGDAYFRTKLITNNTYPSGLARPADITVTWTGTLNQSWTTAGNWSSNSVPTSVDNVLIPAGTPFSPLIANTIVAVCYYIKVEPGANITVDTGGTLNVGL